MVVCLRGIVANHFLKNFDTVTLAVLYIDGLCPVTMPRQWPKCFCMFVLECYMWRMLLGFDKCQANVLEAEQCPTGILIFDHHGESGLIPGNRSLDIFYLYRQVM